MKHLLPTAIAFLLVVGCGPDEKTQQELSVQVKLLDSLHRQHNALMEQSITKRDSVIAGLQRTVRELKSSDSTTRVQMYYINLKADSAIVGVSNIDDRALRKYNRAHSLGGLVDGLTGSKVSKAVDIFKKR